MLKSVSTLLAGLLLCANLALAAVNINTATKDELDSVKGIGPSKAQAIIDYRNKNGAFKSLEELSNVKGFGEKSIAKLKGELTVSGASSAAKPAPAKAGNNSK